MLDVTIGLQNKAFERQKGNAMKQHWKSQFCIAAMAMQLFGIDSAEAEGLNTPDLFTAYPHSFLSFEVDGVGNPVVLAEGAVRSMPDNEYAAQGILFSPGIHWLNDAASSYDAAQAIGGSSPISVHRADAHDFVLTFTVTVRAFGFWVIHNNSVAEQPTFTALDVNGVLLETVSFGPQYRDGIIDTAEYGFMGILSDRIIGSVLVTENGTELDNLYFAAVPEPSAVALLFIGAFGLLWYHNFSRKRKEAECSSDTAIS